MYLGVFVKSFDIFICICVGFGLCNWGNWDTEGNCYGIEYFFSGECDGLKEMGDGRWEHYHQSL